jgi:hypothetical protein
MRQNEAFEENYRYLRGCGLTHDQIALNLGVKREALMRRLHRLGLYIPEPAERQTLEVLERLIEGGEPFTIDHLPEAGAQHLLMRAWHAGRLERVGTRPSITNGVRVIIYRKKRS